MRPLARPRPPRHMLRTIPRTAPGPLPFTFTYPRACQVPFPAIIRPALFPGLLPLPPLLIWPDLPPSTRKIKKEDLISPHSSCHCHHDHHTLHCTTDTDVISIFNLNKIKKSDIQITNNFYFMCNKKYEITSPLLCSKYFRFRLLPPLLQSCLYTTSRAHRPAVGRVHRGLVWRLDCISHWNKLRPPTPNPMLSTQSNILCASSTHDNKHGAYGKTWERKSNDSYSVIGPRNNRRGRKWGCSGRDWCKGDFRYPLNCKWFVFMSVVKDKMLLSFNSIQFNSIHFISKSKQFNKTISSE